MDKAVTNYVMDAQGDLRTAMVAIDRSGAEIVLVVDGERLLGVLTDGDIRRALIGGAELNTPAAPHMTKDCVTVGPQVGRNEVLDLMSARRISQIPVVGEGRQLLGLHLLQDMIGVATRPNWAVVMAGGKGTRLGELTKNTPKPMIRVAGRPILERIVLHLVGHGIRRIFLSINYLGEQIEKHFGDGSEFGAQIEYLKEDTPLDTGGPLALLPEAPQHPTIVMNVDVVTHYDVGRMLDFHNESGAIATMGVRRYFHHVPFGCLNVEGHAIRSFEEKPTLSKLVNAGIYALSPEIVSRVPKNTPFPLPRLFEDALKANEAVHAYEIIDDWIDVGQKAQLKQARGEE